MNTILITALLVTYLLTLFYIRRVAIQESQRQRNIWRARLQYRRINLAFDALSKAMRQAAKAISNLKLPDVRGAQAPSNWKP